MVRFRRCLVVQDRRRQWVTMGGAADVCFTCFILRLYVDELVPSCATNRILFFQNPLLIVSSERFFPSSSSMFHVSLGQSFSTA